MIRNVLITGKLSSEILYTGSVGENFNEIHDLIFNT